MEGVWLISYLALWLLTVLLGIVILAHSRLLGILHQRFGPAGAKPLAEGPDIGSKLGTVVARQLDGGRWEWRFPAPTGLLAIFVSPQCQICNELLLHAIDFHRKYPELPLALVSTMDDLGMNRAYVAYRRLEKMHYVAGSDLAEAMNVDATPYAVCIDRQGVVLAKGLVNHYEHLLSLWHAVRAAESVRESA